MALPIHSRLLTAWHRTQTSRCHITSLQFIVLCSIIETAARGEYPTTAQRSQQLGICQNSIAVAQRTLEHHRLVTLTPDPDATPPPYPRHPHLHARPTPAALKLFSNRRGRKPSKPSLP